MEEDEDDSTPLVVEVGDCVEEYLDLVELVSSNEEDDER